MIKKEDVDGYITDGMRKFGCLDKEKLTNQQLLDVIASAIATASNVTVKNLEQDTGSRKSLSEKLASDQRHRAAFTAKKI